MKGTFLLSTRQRSSTISTTNIKVHRESDVLCYMTTPCHHTFIIEYNGSFSIAPMDSMINKVEKKLKHWCNQWIFFSGRLTLLNLYSRELLFIGSRFHTFPVGSLNVSPSCFFGFLWKYYPS